jgi:F-type H+-transporting ATPase subunit b
MRKHLLLLMMVCLTALFPVLPVSAAEEPAHGEETAEHAEGGHEQTIWQTIGQWTNFVVLVTILYLFLTRSIRVQDKYKAESQQIRESIESARLAKEEAERQMAAMDERMQQMNDEISRIKERALQDAEDEKTRILNSAQKEAHRIVEMAHREIDNEVRAARKQLRKHVAGIAIEKGENIIQKEINEEDQRRLIHTYIQEFGK